MEQNLGHRRDVMVAFSTAHELKQLQRAVLFENQRAIASEFADWFDQQILKRATPLEQWLRERGLEEAFSRGARSE